MRYLSGRFYFLLWSGLILINLYSGLYSGAIWAADQPQTDVKGRLELISELDLDTAARIALAQNPSLAAAQARLEQARQVIQQARSAYWPTLDANVSASHVKLSENDYQQQSLTAIFFHTTVEDPEDYYRAGLTATWVLFDGFYRKFNLLSAKHGEQFSAAGRDEVQRLLLSAVIAAFLQTQLAQENIAIADADLSFNQRLLTEAQLRYEVGAGALSDVLNFQIKANSAQSSKIQAGQALQTGMIGLAALLGLPDARMPGHIRLAQLLPASEAELTVLVPDSLLEKAYALRPALKQGEWAVQLADAGVGAAEANFYPTLALSGAYTGERADNAEFETDDFGNSVTLSLSYNIFAGGLHRARHQEAKVKLREARHNYQDAHINVSSEVMRTIARVRGAQDQLALQQTNTQLVQKNRDLVEKEYKAGVGSLVRLNEAQRDLTASQVQLATARVALRQAWYDLHGATGQILEQFK